MYLRKLADNMLYTYKGQVIIAMILGVGFSLMFQRVCTGKNKCALVFAPPIAEVRSTIFKIDDECYRYSTKKVECVSDALPPMP